MQQNNKAGKQKKRKAENQKWKTKHQKREKAKGKTENCTSSWKLLCIVIQLFSHFNIKRVALVGPNGWVEDNIWGKKKVRSLNGVAIARGQEFHAKRDWSYSCWPKGEIVLVQTLQADKKECQGVEVKGTKLTHTWICTHIYNSCTKACVYRQMYVWICDSIVVALNSHLRS